MSNMTTPDRKLNSEFADHQTLLSRSSRLLAPTLEMSREFLPRPNSQRLQHHLQSEVLSISTELSALTLIIQQDQVRESRPSSGTLAMRNQTLSVMRRRKHS